MSFVGLNPKFHFVEQLPTGGMYVMMLMMNIKVNFNINISEILYSSFPPNEVPPKIVELRETNRKASQVSTYFTNQYFFNLVM